MPARYVPDSGDIVWMDFNPQLGREQAGRRPAVVLSPKAYNVKSSLLVCVPITNQIKGYPFEVVLSGAVATGAALSDQIKSMDWQARKVEVKGKASLAEIAEVTAKIRALLMIG